MKIRYIGTENYQEYPVTGTNALWQPQWVSDVSDTRATALVALGTFVYEDDSTYANQLKDRAAELDALGVRAGTWTPIQSITGRDASLANSNFYSFTGNGQTWYQADMQGANSAGVAGVLERVNDSDSLTGGSSSALGAGNLYAWKLQCLPTHVVTAQRPRSMIYGNTLDVGRDYRIKFRFRFNHINAAGWDTLSYNRPSGSLFALSQMSQSSPPYQFSSGQLGDFGNSPLYIQMAGTSLYPQVMAISETMGDDSGAYRKWASGDRVNTNTPLTEVRVMDGRRYHTITLDFRLDHRRLRDGGEGYFKLAFDGKPWLDYEGITYQPANAAGLFMPMSPHVGFYETSGAVSPDGTLCSAINSCSIERSIFIDQFTVLERN